MPQEEQKKYSLSNDSRASKATWRISLANNNRICSFSHWTTGLPPPTSTWDDVIVEFLFRLNCCSTQLVAVETIKMDQRVSWRLTGTQIRFLCSARVGVVRVSNDSFTHRIPALRDSIFICHKFRKSLQRCKFWIEINKINSQLAGEWERAAKQQKNSVLFSRSLKLFVIAASSVRSRRRVLRSSSRDLSF